MEFIDLLISINRRRMIRAKSNRPPGKVYFREIEEKEVTWGFLLGI